MRGKRKNIAHLLGMLMNLPWHVTVMLGEFLYVALKWVLPALCPSDTVYQLLALALSDLAWLFSGFFVVLGLAMLSMQKKQRPGHWRQAAHPAP